MGQHLLRAYGLTPAVAFERLCRPYLHLSQMELHHLIPLCSPHTETISLQWQIPAADKPECGSIVKPINWFDMRQSADWRRLGNKDGAEWKGSSRMQCNLL